MGILGLVLLERSFLALCLEPCCRQSGRMTLEFWAASIVMTATPGTGVLFTIAAGLAGRVPAERVTSVEWGHADEVLHHARLHDTVLAFVGEHPCRSGEARRARCPGPRRRTAQHQHLRTDRHQLPLTHLRRRAD